MSEWVLRVKDVTKEFHGEKVLKKVNLEIMEGETLGIWGKGGAGKSVLIHMLRGMSGHEPTNGKIIYRVSMCPSCLWVDQPSMEDHNCHRCNTGMKLEEIDFWKPENKKFRNAIKQRISIMFQRTFALYGDRSPLENVMEALWRSGYADEKRIMDKSIELLKMLNLIHRVLHPARDLSGGEKQRAVLARQLAIDPILLLADEPTGTLDLWNRELVYRTLTGMIKAKRKAMVVTSHLPETIAKLADKVIWLDSGKIRMEGSPKEVIDEFMSAVKPIGKKVKPEVGEDVIRLDNIKKYYCSVERGLIRAVDGVSLNIKEKEIFGLVGLSGAGKTTVSRIINGITQPTDGEVYVRIGEHWIDMRELGPFGKGRAAPYLRMLHQEYALYPYRTVEENLTDSIDLGLPDEFAKIKVLYVLGAVGIKGPAAKSILDKYPDELSESERHRVALAQVLIKEPKILILDEPSGTMDPITKVEVARSIRESRTQLEATMLIVSHDLDFINLTCDRVALMRDGHFIKICGPNEVEKELTVEELEKIQKNLTTKR